MNKKLLTMLIESFMEETLSSDYVFLEGNATIHADNVGVTHYYSARVNDNTRGEIIYIKINLDKMSEECFNLENINNYLELEILDKQMTQYEINKMYKENPEKVRTTFLENYVKH